MVDAARRLRPETGTMNSGNPKLAVGVASAYYRATLATSAPTDGSQSNGDGNGAVLTQAEQREQAERFERFAELECRGSSPLYHQLALHVATDPEVLDLMAFARPTPRRPNLLFAAVHFLLLGGLPHRLRLFYPSLVEAPDEADPWPSFRSLCL